MASTTWVVRETDPTFIFATSSLISDRPALRKSGSKRLSIRYCLSADRSRPNYPGESCADIRIRAGSRATSRTGLRQFRTGIAAALHSGAPYAVADARTRVRVGAKVTTARRRG